MADLRIERRLSSTDARRLNDARQTNDVRPLTGALALVLDHERRKEDLIETSIRLLGVENERCGDCFLFLSPEANAEQSQRDSPREKRRQGEGNGKGEKIVSPSERVVRLPINHWTLTTMSQALVLIVARRLVRHERRRQLVKHDTRLRARARIPRQSVGHRGGHQLP